MEWIRKDELHEVSTGLALSVTLVGSLIIRLGKMVKKNQYNPLHEHCQNEKEILKNLHLEHAKEKMAICSLHVI